MASTITRRRSTGIRLAAAALLSLLVVVTGIAIRSTALASARRFDISVTHVDPGLLGYLALMMFAGFAWMVGQRLLVDWRPSRAALLYYAWVLVFTAANTVNRCQPGWCATIGFPFSWQSWSDALFIDDSFRPMMNGLGAVMDLVTFVAVATLVARTAPPSTRVSPCAWR